MQVTFIQKIEFWEPFEFQSRQNKNPLGKGHKSDLLHVEDGFSQFDFSWATSLQ